jgi:hypothetical protein
VRRAAQRGEYFPITTFLRLIAHARLTFLFLQSGAVFLRRRRAERLASDEKSVREKAGTVTESF